MLCVISFIVLGLLAWTPASEGTSAFCPSTDCPLVFTERVRGYAIDDANDKKIFNVADVEACEQLCEDETDFECVSAEFSIDKCQLSVSRKCTPGAVYTQWRSYFYRERRNICTDCELQTQDAVVGYAITNYNNKRVNDVSLEECIQLCVDETAFQCLSVDYKNIPRYCFLSSVNKASVPNNYIVYPEFTYVERVYYCPL